MWNGTNSYRNRLCSIRIFIFENGAEKQLRQETKKGKKELISRPLFGEYCLKSGWGNVWIYYPLQRLKEYDLQKIGIAWCSNGAVPKEYYIARAEVCGEYAVFYLPMKGEDISFMLVDHTDE